MTVRALCCLVALAGCGDNRVVVDPCLLVRCIGDGCLDGEPLGEGDARRMAVGTTRLFWFDRAGTLFDLPLAGGEQTMVVETDMFIAAVRTSGDRLVWANNFGAEIYEPEVGVRSLTDDAITFGFAMDDAAIYYGIQNNLLVRLTLADATPRAWAATQATALGVAIAGADLYFTNCESVFRARNEELGPQETIARAGCPVDIASNARTVAWTEKPPVGETGTNTIRGYNTTTGAIADLVTTLPDEVVVHVDDEHVYYAGGGGLCRVPVGGGVPAKLVVGAAFALDTSDIYWSLNGELFRAAKPPD